MAALPALVPLIVIGTAGTAGTAGAAGAAGPAGASSAAPRQAKAAGQPAAQAGLEALDTAFRFASAIHADPKDRSQAQESVVLDYATLHAFERAITSAGLIQDWRRGTAYADIALLLAQDGRKKEAADLLDKAESVRATITGWQNPRISAHIAHALAVLGETERARTMARDVVAGDRQQYSGQAVATLAVGLAGRGQFAEAMKTLDEAAKDKDNMAVWWRTMGYLDLSRSPALPPAQRREALGRARRSADGIRGWEKAEALQKIAAGALAEGQSARAREALASAETITLAQPTTMPVKSQLLANLAQAWSNAGDTRRARALLVRAESEIPNTLDIERPAVYGNVAASYLALRDDKNGMRMLDTALEGAESLGNARPRALAVVEICRSLGRANVPLTPALRTRLETLYAGLKDPW